jgi:hypothetical protein
MSKFQEIMAKYSINTIYKWAFYLMTLVAVFNFFTVIEQIRTIPMLPTQIAANITGWLLNPLWAYFFFWLYNSTISTPPVPVKTDKEMISYVN